MTDKEKLCKAVDGFAAEMKKRLMAKSDEGFKGWDAKGINTHSIPTRLFYKASEVYAMLAVKDLYVQTKVLVDIANFAMMLWFKRGKYNEEDSP